MAAKIRLPMSSIQPVIDFQPRVPNRVFRGRSQDAHGHFLDRVYEFNATGVEMDGSVVVGAPRAVLDVAFDWCAEATQGSSNLMVPSGFWLDFDKVVMVGAADSLVGQFRLLSVFSGFVVGKTFIQLAIFLQEVHYMSFGRVGSGANNGPVCFLDVAQTKKIGQTRQSFGGAGIENNATDRSIEAMHGSDEGIAGLVVFSFNVFSDNLAKCGITAGVTLHNVR